MTRIVYRLAKRGWPRGVRFTRTPRVVLRCLTDAGLRRLSTRTPHALGGRFPAILIDHPTGFDLGALAKAFDRTFGSRQHGRVSPGRAIMLF